MQRYVLWKFNLRVILIFILFISIGFTNTFAGGKVGIYGIYMVPKGVDAENFSRPGFGFGLRAVIPVPQLANILAGTIGFEVINLLNKTVRFRDRTIGLLVDQETSQDYYRLFIGAQVGGHGNGFLRPHAGINIALVYYNISTELVVGDDWTGEEIVQSVSDEGSVVAGYDITLGIDLNFSNKLAVDGGVRYLQSFSVPQQLGEGSEKIHPQYFQIYLGIGASFDMIKGG